MAFRLRDGNGEALWAAGSLQGEGGQARTYAGLDAAHFEPLRHWRSPRTGVRYPVEWKLQIGGRELHLVPLMDDQELDSRRSTGAIYWEGAVRCLEGGQDRGRGYLEMTGYGDRIRVG